MKGSQDWQITGEAREVWPRQRKKKPMDEIRRNAIQEVDDMVESGELESFADVRQLIKHPRTAGEYRYGEELISDARNFPKPGQYWVTAEDEQLMKDDKADIVACSSELDVLAGGHVKAERER